MKCLSVGAAPKVLHWLMVAAISILGLSSAASAQTVGTLGIAELNYSGAKRESVSSDEAVSGLSRALSRNLIETRKFTVLEYKQLVERFRAEGLKLQGFYNKEYQGHELEQAGLDYILTADITELGVFEQQRGQSTDSIGLVEVDFKLLGVADATLGFESSVSAQMKAEMPQSGEVNKTAIIERAIERASDQLVDQIITTLHPIRVMKIGEDSAITLNYGAGMFEPGDTVLIYPDDQDLQINRKGDVQIDPIATLQIVSTQKKFARAQALDGFDALEKGQKGRLLLTDG